LAAAQGTTAAVTRPSGAATGDLLLLSIAAQTATAISAPAGWTELVNVQDGVSARRYAIYYRWDDGAAGPWTFTWGGGNVFRWWRCVAYSGVHPSDPINAFASQINASSVSAVAPTVTTDADDCLLVMFASPDGAVATWTPPGGMTAFDDLANSVFAAQQQLAAAGATGTRTGTLSTAQRHQAALIALAPVPPALAPYEKTIWTPGMDVTDDRLNNIEDGIELVNARAIELPSPEEVGALDTRLDNIEGYASSDRMFFEGASSEAAIGFGTTPIVVMSGTFIPQRSRRYSFRFQTIFVPLTQIATGLRADLSVVLGTADADGRTTRTATQMRNSGAAENIIYETIAVDSWFNLVAGVSYAVSVTAVRQGVASGTPANWQFWNGRTYTYGTIE
jgi:hypothetical protein